jgi:hypothetical protein
MREAHRPPSIQLMQQTGRNDGRRNHNFSKFLVHGCGRERARVCSWLVRVRERAAVERQVFDNEGITENRTNWF